MTKTKKNLMDALELCFSSDAGKNITVRDYLYSLLDTLWAEQECFSGKQPFGNSDWTSDLYLPLVKAGYLKGDLEEGCGPLCLDEEEEAKAHRFVHKLIKLAFYPKKVDK